MQKMIAFCGVICTECPVYIATQKNDDERRKKVAQKWSSADEPLKPEDINCDGCLVVGKKLYQFCATCEVRTCGFKKKVENCAYCDEYPCEKLNKHWEEENVVGIERVGKEWGNKAKANLEDVWSGVRSPTSYCLLFGQCNGTSFPWNSAKHLT